MEPDSNTLNMLERMLYRKPLGYDASLKELKCLAKELHELVVWMEKGNHPDPEAVYARILEITVEFPDAFTDFLMK